MSMDKEERGRVARLAARVTRAADGLYTLELSFLDDGTPTLKYLNGGRAASGWDGVGMFLNGYEAAKSRNSV